MDTHASRYTCLKTTVFVLYLIGLLLLKSAEALKPIRIEADVDVNYKGVYVEVTTPSESVLARDNETRLSALPSLVSVEEKSPSPAPNKDIIERSQVVEYFKSLHQQDDESLRGYDVESRWFPIESYAEKLKELGLLASSVKKTIGIKQEEIITRLNTLLPHTLRFKERKKDKGGSVSEDDFDNSEKKRTKRSWGDFWYDYDIFDYCDYPPCPAWSEWHGTGLCDAPCGGGKRLLVRYCNNSKTDEFQGGCDGESTKLETCNTHVCPIWSEWTPSDECSVTCGRGIRKYKRHCVANGKPVNGCVGPNVEFRVCSSNNSCPAQWTNWSKFGSCTKSCGQGGVQFRRRLCIVNGIPIRSKKTPCQGFGAQQRRCPSQPRCPPRFSQWTTWGPCDAVTCNATGYQSRSRKCLGPSGKPLSKYKMNCPPDQLESRRQCKSQSCEKACNIVLADFAHINPKADDFKKPKPTWSQWTPWNDCTVTCGLGGQQSRNRMCFDVSIDSKNSSIILNEDKTCEGKAVETRECHYNIGCPHWDKWQKWGGCTRTCGLGGSRTRRRSCVIDIYERFNAGEVLESSKVLEKIGNRAQNDQSGEGSAEVEGSAEDSDLENLPRATMYSGGNDLYRKQRKLIRRDSLSLRWCEGGHNASFVVANCNAHPCPPRWGRWQAWGKCSVTCGKGQMQRSRRCIGKGYCHGSNYEFKDCYQPPCWSDWSPFTPCTKSCGSGQKMRYRKCHGTTFDVQEYRDCKGPKQQNMTCSEESCPKWGEWATWGKCSAPCDGGTRMRSRVCIRGDCNGINNDISSCNYQPCPYWDKWSTFSCCSVTCGVGIKTRNRICRHGEPGVEGCQGPINDAQSCDQGSCNVTASPDLDSIKCGAKPQNKTNFVLKIYNGEISDDHEWPWQASWQHYTCVTGLWHKCAWEHLCGATLLGPKWVVTAGHCIEEWIYRVVHDDPGDEWSVVIGMTKLYKTGERFYLRRVFLHPGYEYRGVPRNDIALLKLRDRVPVSDYTMPACLPNNNQPHESKNCFVTGWGNLHARSTLSPFLREAALPILDFGVCQSLGDVYRNYLNKKWHMCAGDVSSDPNAADSCKGDSGGPMVCDRPDGKWYIAGITSFGFRDCGTPGHAGIYVPVNNYEQWIRDTIEKYSHNGC